MNFRVNYDSIYRNLEGMKGNRDENKVLVFMWPL